jgi:hypothetical protein
MGVCYGWCPFLIGKDKLYISCEGGFIRFESKKDCLAHYKKCQTKEGAESCTAYKKRMKKWGM